MLCFRRNMFWEVAFHHLPLLHWTLNHQSHMFCILLSTEFFVGRRFSKNLNQYSWLFAVILNHLCTYVYRISPPYPRFSFQVNHDLKFEMEISEINSLQVWNCTQFWGAWQNPGPSCSGHEWSLCPTQLLCRLPACLLLAAISVIRSAVSASLCLCSSTLSYLIMTLKCKSCDAVIREGQREDARCFL